MHSCANSLLSQIGAWDYSKDPAEQSSGNHGALLSSAFWTNSSVYLGSNLTLS